MKGSNASLTYTDEQGTYAHRLWIMQFDQPHQLSGSTQQSRTKRHFYPRAWAPGDIAVSGRCESQVDYQRLGRFIRGHQRALISAPVTDRYARINTNAPGYKRLLRLSIPTERLLVRGWIGSFGISKKGVFDPAPEYNFNFFVVFDSTATNIGISHRIKKYYDSTDYVVSTRRSPVERDIPPNLPEGTTIP